MDVEKPNFRYEQEKDSKYKQSKQEVVEFILSQEYGTTLESDELAKMMELNLEFEEDYQRFKDKMAVIKNFLVRYGYILKAVPGIGYYILKPSQISSYCYRNYVKKAMRMYDKCDFVLDRVDKTYLDGMRMQEYKEMKDLTSKLISNTENVVFNSDYFDNKNKYDFMEN